VSGIGGAVLDSKIALTLYGRGPEGRATEAREVDGVKGSREMLCRGRRRGGGGSRADSGGLRTPECHFRHVAGIVATFHQWNEDHGRSLKLTSLIFDPSRGLVD
jgi:hypothetical protein